MSLDPILATSIEQALDIVNQNIQSLSETNTDFRERFLIWRTEFFPLLDKEDPEQAKIHSWIIPTIVIENELGAQPTQEWFVVTEVMKIVNATLSAITQNGFTPSVGQDIAMTQAYNNAWTVPGAVGP